MGIINVNIITGGRLHILLKARLDRKKIGWIKRR